MQVIMKANWLLHRAGMTPHPLWLPQTREHSHSRVPLVDSGKKIKLPNLFSLVPGTISGGFKAFN